MLSNRFNIQTLLESIAGYKGLPFPLAQSGVPAPMSAKVSGTDYQAAGEESERQTHADNGALLRRYDLLGNHYFMPVVFSAGGKDYEIDCALISVQLKKTVVETPLVGQRGTVKELINEQDLQISVTGCLIGEKQGRWPEDRIADLYELYGVNEAVSLRCALTDCFFNQDDKVVITDMDFPAADKVEDVVAVSLRCVSDRVFQLNIE